MTESKSEQPELTWEEVFEAEDNGTYKSLLSIGNVVPMDCGTLGILQMQVVAFDTDVLADGTGNAKITWIAKDALGSNRALASSSQRTWEGCSTYTYLRGTFFDAMPSVVRNRVVAVTKYTRDYGGEESTVIRDDASSNTIWIPSVKEVFNSGSYIESIGVTYTSFFKDNASRIKHKVTNLETAYQWRLRTWGTSNSRSVCVTTSGAATTGVVISTSSGSAIVPCFCT